MTTQLEPLAYPFGDAGRLKLHPMYARLRAQPGLAKVQPPFGATAWLATRYEDVKKVLSDPRFSRAKAIGEDAPRLVAFLPPPDTLMAMDPPDHTRLRRVVAQAFTMRQIENLRPRVQGIVDDLLDTMDNHGGLMDMVRSFALPASVTVICELLGIPYEDREQFGAWVEAIMSSEDTQDDAQQANEDLMSYLGRRVTLRREEPADDLLGILVAAHEAGDRLTDHEVVGLASAVLIAGYIVTFHQIGNFVYALLADPARFGQLREHPELVPQAVEEMLRYVPPAVGEGVPRVASEDVELGGTLVRAGEAVLPSTMSANRDESVFPAADRMDFTRRDNPHLGFGHGPHHCLGAQLARLELQVVMASLVQRLPTLRLAVPADEVPWRDDTVWSGPRELMVAW
jgi:nocardicin N-oxygenase